MGGNSSPPAQTTTIQKTEIPAWLENVTKENIAKADEISRRPYESYGGSLRAGLAPEQEQAFDYMKGGVGMTTPLYDRATGVTSDVSNFMPKNVDAGRVGFERVGAQSFLDGNLAGYMNPFVDNVESAALSRLNDATRQSVTRLGDQARSAGAFGGSRHGIAEGVALGEASRSAGELSSGLRSQAFDRAAALMQSDQQRAMQAALANQQAGLTTSQANMEAGMRAQLANQQAAQAAAQTRLAAGSQLGTLAGQQQQARLMDATLLEGIGGQRQAQQQAALDEAYARWKQERDYPIEMLNLRLGATSATPYSQTQTSTSTRSGGDSGNGLMQGLGAIGTGVGIAANLASIFAF